jgi:hypothetical protein
MKYSIDDRANRYTLKQQEDEIRSLTGDIKPQWIKFCDSKVAFYHHYQLNYIYLHPKIGEQLAVPLLIVFMLAVYFIDLVFAYNISEYQARLAFHNNSYAIVFAIFVLPLAFVTIEIFVNYLTYEAKLEAEKRSNKAGKVWKYRAFLLLSLILAMTIPFLFLATGFKGEAKAGNPVFLGLLLGLTVMVGIVHIVTIFAGGKITAAKNRVVALWQHKRLKGKMQDSYDCLSKIVDDAENSYTNYLRDVQDYNRGRTAEDRYLPVPMSELVRYLIRYIARDYYHIPPGEEPGFDDDKDDRHPSRLIAA